MARNEWRFRAYCICEFLQSLDHMRIMFIAMTREQPHGQINRQQFVERELHAVQRPAMIEKIAPPFCDQSSPHGFKDSQITENGTRINLKLAGKFAGCPPFWALGQLSFDLLNPLY